MTKATADKLTGTNLKRRHSMPILLVDDEPLILKSFSIMLRSMGFKDIITVSDSREVMPTLDKTSIAAAVLDLSMPHISGDRLLSEISLSFPQVPVIILTARNDLDTAVECMRKGAFDYLVKPVEKSRLESSIRRAVELRALRSEVDSLKEHLLLGRLEHEDAFSAITTVNRKMRAIFQYVEVVAASDQPVLITGETGVGKELVAKAVHAVSGRSGPFVEVNVAGLDDTVFSDTLFGHKKGAFTGADDTRDGLVARAAGGTLFLDEIGDTRETSQVKLLRLLQENRYYPLGSDLPRESDVRVVVATNRDLQSMMTEGTFRKDLYYRLFGHHISIPPLRERTEDIALLLDSFLGQAANSMKKKKPSFSPELITLLKTYNFPGNVRELKAMVFDAVARHKSGVLSMDSFRITIGKQRGHASGEAAPTGTDATAVSGDFIFSTLTPESFITLKDAEESLVKRALELSDGNQGIAASLLGMTRQALNKRLKRKKQ